MKDVKTGLIRKVVSRLSLGDKSFFESIMNLENI